MAKCEAHCTRVYVIEDVRRGMNFIFKIFNSVNLAEKYFKQFF